LVSSDEFAMAAQFALNRGEPVSVQYMSGKQWSNAAWPC
jgi:hypothetical protein